MNSSKASIYLTIATFALIACGCDKAYTGSSAPRSLGVSLSLMHANSNSLEQVLTNESVFAVIEAVYIVDANNDRETLGSTNFKNNYTLKFKRENGKFMIINGVNASPNELEVMKRLQVGKAYNLVEEFAD